MIRIPEEVTLSTFKKNISAALLGHKYSSFYLNYAKSAMRGREKKKKSVYNQTTQILLKRCFFKINFT